MLPEPPGPEASGLTADGTELPLGAEESAADGVGDKVGAGVVEGDNGVRVRGEGVAAAGPVLGLTDVPDGTVTEGIGVDGGVVGEPEVEEFGVEEAAAGAVVAEELASGALRPAELATARDAEPSGPAGRPVARRSVPAELPECPEPVCQPAGLPAWLSPPSSAPTPDLPCFLPGASPARYAPPPGFC